MDLEFVINQGLDGIGDVCPCKHTVASADIEVGVWKFVLLLAVRTDHY